MLATYGGWCTQHDKPLCPECGVCPHDPTKHLDSCSLREVLPFNASLDSFNAEILKRRTADFARVPGPRVGDWLQLSNGYVRFSHDWDDSIQVTCSRFGDGSFYLGDGGYVSYSGSLDPAIPKEKLEDTGRVRPARFWFFSHNERRAHNGIDVSILCKVWAMKDGEL